MTVGGTRIPKSTQWPAWGDGGGLVDSREPSTTKPPLQVRGHWTLGAQLPDERTERKGADARL